MRCPFCGSSLEKDAKYCNDCGTAVDSECKGKNLNYRSYIDTRPQATNTPKTPSFRIRENDASDRPAQKSAQPVFTQNKNTFTGKIPTVPNATPGQFGQYKGNTAKPVKKNGCGIAILVIIGLFSITGVLGAIFEDVDIDSVFSTEPTSVYEYNYDYDYADEDGFTNETLRGRVDGDYYLNDNVNFAFTVPEGFKEQSAFAVDYGFSMIPDYRFENDEGDYILVGFSAESDAYYCLNDYVSEVYESMTDSGYNLETSDISEKQVYNNSFFTQRVSRADGRTVDIFTCPFKDMVFFVEINTSSAEINDKVAGSFVNSYASF